MYFPYLRGKTNELVLLDDCRELIRTNERIIPLIEPVNDSLNNLINKIEGYVNINIPIILIVNPTVGDLANNPNRIFDFVVPRLNQKGNSHILGFIITERTTREDVHQFLQRSINNRVCFIHSYEFADPNLLRSPGNLLYQIFLQRNVGTAYQRHFLEDNNGVIIKDGFNRQDKNANYPNDDLFFDINLTYARNHFIGFGDYLIVGENYRKNGGPAYAVAIHVTYRDTSGEIKIRHFISDRVELNVDTPGKFAEALAKLIQEKSRPGSLLADTQAMRGFQNLFDTGHYPGLGFVKKLSMEHHIELISTII